MTVGIDPYLQASLLSHKILGNQLASVRLEEVPCDHHRGC
jgi:hypothetical protein